MIRKLILPCAAFALMASLPHAKTTPVKEAVPVSKGQMTDSRDGTIYNTVTIGSQRWMAENLNFRTGASGCYGKKAANCAKYGRLYDWETARSACPRGWHLPSDREWTQLEGLIGQGANAQVGEKLKAASPGWDGSDAYSFAVLPAGGSYSDGSFGYLGSSTYFWSATADGDGGAWGRYFGSGVASLYRGSYNIETYRKSVRCLEILVSGIVRAKTKSKEAVIKGTMTDKRNGTTYNTVKIGLQNWMAENLDYSKGASWCYDNKPENCEKYGRLYDWKTAGEACPQGWHLPTDEEWNQLESAVNDNALELMSTEMKGTDVYGFAALPAGYRSGVDSFNGVGSNARFWSVTAGGDDDAWLRLFRSGAASVSRDSYYKTIGHSVRCLEN
jgi:uncharacterized protein (TIGR02145 family)